jgi:PAS domain S-box-containing protein
MREPSHGGRIDEDRGPLGRPAGRLPPLALGDLSVSAALAAEALVASQAQILESIASGTALAEVLHALVATIEAQAEGLIGSLLLLEDGVHLRHGAAPHLPETYCRAIDGTSIGPKVGSCGTAAYTGELVIVTDIATDPLWDDFRHLALPHGLRACWSQPVLARSGAVLGTFAMYYREPRAPSPSERRLIEMAAHLASIAIERAQSERVLREREASFRLLFAQSPLPMWVHDLEDLRFLEVNDAAIAQYGYPREELLDMRVTALRTLEDRVPSGDGMPAEALPETGVWRHRRKDGRVIEAKVVAHSLAFRGRRAVLVVAEDVTEPRRHQRHLAVLATLDHRLGSAATAAEAARCIADCARSLWAWGAFRVDLYEGDLLQPILALDGADGVEPQRWPCVLRAPLRAGGRAIGMLTMQGSSHRPYDEDDKRALQDLADRCGGVLDRIAAAESVRRSEERLRVQYAVTRILAECAGLQEAAPALMETLCCAIGWPAGALWLVQRPGGGGDTEAGSLRSVCVFPAAGVHSGFLAVARGTEFARGQGLPGQVWATGQAVCVVDLAREGDALHAAAASSALHSACAFPVPVDGQVVGVMELFGQEARPPDRELCLLMSDVGRQLGLFVARCRAEDAVRDREARFRSVFAGAGAGMAISDASGRFLLANPALGRFLGYSKEEMVGLSVYDFTHADDLAETVRQAQEVRDGRQELVDLEKRYVRKDGSIVWGHATVVCVPEAPGGPSVRFAIIQDITKRKRAEEALRESEQRYGTLFAGTRDAVFMADREGRLVEANPAALALFGYSQEELGHLRMGDLYMGGSAAYSFLRTVAREGEVQDFELKMRRRDGTPMDCLVTAGARRDAAGRVVRYQGIIRDVTAQRQAERGLRDLSAHLLRLQDEERRRLARELHDSTGQDLAALAINLAVALREAEALGPRGRKAVADCQAIADRCARGLRTLSYLLHPPLLDEMGLVAAVRWLAEGFQARSGIHLSLALPEDLGRLGADMETALFRIVQEALTNVHRHSGSARAWVRLVREGQAVRLEIEDDGAPGPAPGRERRAGMGVGIAGMKERARQLGGHLEVSGGPRGTTVRAVFPLAPEA